MICFVSLRVCWSSSVAPKKHALWPVVKRLPKPARLNLRFVRYVPPMHTILPRPPILASVVLRLRIDAHHHHNVAKLPCTTMRERPDSLHTIRYGGMDTKRSRVLTGCEGDTDRGRLCWRFLVVCLLHRFLRPSLSSSTTDLRHCKQWKEVLDDVFHPEEQVREAWCVFEELYGLKRRCVDLAVALGCRVSRNSWSFELEELCAGFLQECVCKCRMRGFFSCAPHNRGVSKLQSRLKCFQASQNKLHVESGLSSGLMGKDKLTEFCSFFEKNVPVALRSACVSVWQLSDVISLWILLR